MIMNKNEIAILNEKEIENKVYMIRGIPVMLDKDLALIYGYSVKALNQQVQRNIEKFPNDMAFPLTNYEYSILKSQIVTSSWGRC